jgi:septum formation protein
MVILASSSPRRKELLKKLIPDFEVIPADIDENESFVSPYNLPYDLSKRKAYEVFKSHPDDVVIACDTIVIFNDEIFGKPLNEADAKRMLKSLSNNSHVVLSGYTIISKNFEVSKTIKTTVLFNKLDEELIDSYIASGSPMDKAGAYGCQDKDYPLVSSIVGSFDNVMGFPSESIKRDLKRLRVI